MCTNAKCDIYPELYHLDIMRMDLKYPSLEIAQFKLDQLKLDKAEFLKFQKMYNNYVKECKKVMSRIYAMKTSNDAAEKKADKAHKNFLQILKGIADGKIPLNPDVQKGIEDKINEEASQTDILDERFKNQAVRFKGHMKELRKNDKKDDKKDEKTDPSQTSETTGDQTSTNSQ